MDFGYYTFPGILIGVASALYGWQEPRMKGLERGRKNVIQKTVKDLFVSGNLQVVKKDVHVFLADGYVKHKDLLMPIQQFLPYRKIKWCLGGAMFLATVCALFQEKMTLIHIINSPYFTLSVNDGMTSAIILLCSWPAKWLFDEFRYMQRIIKLFDGNDDA